jgi:hypothetical protein
MRTVWKFSIPIYRDVVGTFQVPNGSRVVHVASETLNPGSLSEPGVSLWFEVPNADADREFRVFEVFGTGHNIPDGAGAFVGTALIPDHGLVLHVYERNTDHTDGGQ